MSALSLPLVLVLDLLLGDPRRLPHPVRWLGTLVKRLERRLYPPERSPEAAFGRGLTLCAIVAATAAGAGALFMDICRRAGPAAVLAGEVIVGFYCLSARSLVDAALAVYRPLAAGDLDGGRQALSMIVGRDTGGLDESAAARAAVESIGESITDGIVSPLLYLVAGGPVAALLFKAVSTMDSMIGYRNERYRHFGTCAARLDDVLNFVPARLTAFVIVPLAALVTGGSARGALRCAMRDRLNHPSPNSAHGEAAVAGALGIRLGGTVSYEGRRSVKPHINEGGRSPAVRDIPRAVSVAAGAAVVCVLILGGLRFLITGSVY